MERDGRHNTQKAFTLLELLLAAAVTALVTAAAATMVSGIANAAVQTRDVRETQAAGHYAVARLARTTREARVVGYLTATSVTLWLGDANANDKVNLYELGLIRYDDTNKQILYDYLQAAGAPPATEVTKSELSSSAGVDMIMSCADRKTAVWADDVQVFALTGFPAGTEARIVQAEFELAEGNEAMAFTTSAGPRASADYLFGSGTSAPPLPGSTRIRRLIVSIWEGLGKVQIN